MELNHKVFGKELAGEVGIVMPNHLAGALKSTNGDRAHYLSQATGMTVIAFERPGTGSLPTSQPFTPETYQEDAARRAAELQTEMDKLGVERAILTHDSAGALDALALAASGNMAVSRVVAIEPIGMEVKDNTVDAVFDWARQSLFGDKGKHVAEFKGLKELPDLRKRPSRVALAGLMNKERKGYTDVFCSDIGYRLLGKVAEKGIPTDLILAERSLVVTPKVQAKLPGEFAGSSVNIDVYANTDHNFTEPYHHFVHVVEKKVHSATNPNI